MMPKKYIRLADEDAAKLEDLTRRSLNFRVRSRSQALLWSHQGKDRLTIAEMLGVQPDTVSRWLNKWDKHKLKSLVDLPKSGRPSILNLSEKKVS
jgi:transposase